MIVTILIGWFKQQQWSAKKLIICFVSRGQFASHHLVGCAENKPRGSIRRLVAETESLFWLLGLCPQPVAYAHGSKKQRVNDLRDWFFFKEEKKNIRELQRF
jgi:hypothetical protein